MLIKLVLLSIFAFTSSLTTSFDLRGVINGNRMGGVPLGISLGAGELDVEGICTKSGMACQNCSISVTCVPLPVGWLKVPLEECSEGFTCNAHLGRCSKEAAPECDVMSKSYKHTCEQVGIFPDAYDCRKFHLCSPPDGLPDGRPASHSTALCPRHYGYNPQTAQCSIKLSNGQCSRKPVPMCTKVGQADVLPTSVNHYYVCLQKEGKVYPQIFICPHGWYFWDGFCRPEQQVQKTEAKSAMSEESKSEQDKSSEEVTTSKSTTTKIESFFSTEKAITYAADTFLADKFDLTNYESTDDVAQTNDDFVNSFESNNEWF